MKIQLFFEVRLPAIGRPASDVVRSSERTHEARSGSDCAASASRSDDCTENLTRTPDAVGTCHPATTHIMGRIGVLSTGCLRQVSGVFRLLSPCKEMGDGIRQPPFFAPFRAQGVVVGFEKSTVGGPLRIAGSVTSKYFRGFAPVTFAVSVVGNCRI